MVLLLALLSVLPQDELAARLKRDGAAAAEALGARSELKPDLERVAEGKDPDAAWWARAALAEIEAREKGGKAYVAPRRVTIEAKGRPAHEVLQELLAADGEVLEIDPAKPLPPVDVSLRGVAVHAALDEVCRKAGAALGRGPGGALRVARRGVIGTPSAYAALQSFEVRSVEHRTRADFDGEPRRTSEVVFSVTADPRAGWRLRECRWDFESATDDAGRPLEVVENQSRSWGGTEFVRVEVPLTLRSVPPDARRLARVRGIATLSLWRKPEEATFADVLNAREQVRESGPFRLTFHQVQRQDRRWVALFSHHPKDWPGAPTDDEVRLDDAEGRPFQGLGGGWGEGTLQRQFNPDGQRVPARLRVTLYPDLHVRRVFFELKDLPLR